MRADNIRRPTGTGVLALAMVLITTLLAARAPAQPPSQATATTPDTAATLAALARVERWVRAWEVPPNAEGVEPTPAVGAFVVLRSEGVVIARGEALSASLSTPDPDALRRAAAQALERAAPKLGIPNDALREERLREVAERLSISIELAGDFALIEPAAWDDVDLQLAPGLDGVAARVAGETSRGPSPVETVYPSTMLASAATGTLMVPSRALSVAAAQAIGEGGPAAALDTPSKLRSERSVRMYRFRVSHAVQGPAGTAPTVLYRGSRLVPPGWVPTRAELVSMADRLAAFLMMAADPTAAAAPPSVATAERALAMLALVESREVRDPRADRRESEVATTLQAYEWLESIDPRVAYLAACSIPAGDRMMHQTPRRFAAGMVRGALADSDTPPIVDAGGIAPAPLEAFPSTLRALPLYAATRILATDDSGRFSRVDALIRQRFADPDAAVLSQMPWLGRAELALASRRGIDTIPSAIALRDMRSQLWQHQLTLTDTTPNTLDMSGGIVFTAGLAQGKSSPYPTWHGARPLAFVATMLGDQRLTEPGERARETVRLMQAIRFIRQLQVDEAAAWAYPNPAKAIGGIRSAPWDFSQPVDASAMSLMFITETIKSLDALAAQPAEKQPAAPTPAAP